MHFFNYVIFLLLLCGISTVSHAQPPLSLASHYNQTINLDHYWVSEKLDGVRAYWDGLQLLSRQGKPIYAPPWFLTSLPSTPLDGELWLGRGQFQRTVSIIRKQQPINEEWQQISYMVFDLPASKHIFERRLEQLRTMLNTASSPAKLIPHWKPQSHQQLQADLHQYVQKGAEGLMLHRADSYYQAGRNQDILKLKPYADAEAIVIAYKPGKGKYQNKMGALLVEANSGLQFYLGTGFTDQQRKTPPEIGSIITYRHYGFTKRGIPRHASFVRQRYDYDL